MTMLTEHQKAALKFDKHISLTANAGSGKTFVLSKRYLEIALSQKYPNLRNIAAISFTEKASSELYKKIARETEERLEASNDPVEISKLETIRRQLVSANISTIHSFCIDVLRENPVEAGLDANFSAIDEILSDELIELSVDELLKNIFKTHEDEDRLKYLIRIYGSKSLLTREIISLVKRRKNVLVLADRIYNKSANEIAEYFHKTNEDTFEQIFSPKLPGIISAINSINGAVLNEKPDNEPGIEISSLLKQLDNIDSFIQKISVLKVIREYLLTQSGGVKKRGYLNKLADDFTEEILVIQEFYSSVKSINLDDVNPKIEFALAEFGINLLILFYKALERYNLKKKENGYLDYEDILLFTQEILNNSTVRESLSQKYKYIMIDEYQDTNEIQYNIFLPILDHLKKGNLFVVGDEKQSIYMFRDAELEVFDRTRNDINETEGLDKLLTLPESFRMAPAIALFTNKLFSQIFSEPNLVFNEVEYNDLVCASETETEGRIEILLGGNTSENEEDILEDELIARKILSLVDAGSKADINFSDIAILCRRRKEFKELENTLVKYCIPFVVVGGKGFYQRQSIYDIYNYFSFLLNNEDDTALVGTLRSPFFNISDSKILEISLEKGSTFWAKLKNYSPQDKGLYTKVKVIDENTRLSTSFNITALLRKILNETSYISVIASRSNNAQELANIEKLINVTTAFGNQGFKTLYDYVDYLKLSIQQLEDESQASVTDESNSVKIMTYHQAKGLEFKNVFLHNCSESLRKESFKSKKVVIDKRYGLLTKIPLDDNIAGEYKSAPIVGLAEYIEEKKNIAEFKRLFYVGVTRAIESLYICGTEKVGKSFSEKSFLGLISSLPAFDFSSNCYELNGKLKFTSEKNGKFFTEEKTLSTKIPICREVKQTKMPARKSFTEISGLRFNLKQITDHPEGEFISATKVAVFNQCPLKYQLTYEYGFTRLFNRYKTWYKNQNKSDSSGSDFDYNSREENDDLMYTNDKQKTSGFSAVKGRIIHKILQNDVAPKELDEFVEKNIKNEIDVFDYSENTAQKLKNNILQDINKYFSSSTYKEISTYQTYHNEFEIYLKENDYFLYGIIDKLIIENNKAIIIDYKTDDISSEEIAQRAKNYLPQLEFYSYITGRFFPDVNEIELKLIFIKHPEKLFQKSIKREYLARIRNNLTKMVDSVRNENFTQNLEHCNKCLYSLENNKCVINS